MVNLVLFTIVLVVANICISLPSINLSTVDIATEKVVNYTEDAITVKNDTNIVKKTSINNTHRQILQPPAENRRNVKNDIEYYNDMIQSTWLSCMF